MYPVFFRAEHIFASLNLKGSRARVNGEKNHIVRVDAMPSEDELKNRNQIRSLRNLSALPKILTYHPCLSYKDLLMPNLCSIWEVS